METIHHTEPMHWAVAGGLIGLMTLGLLFIANRRLGMSTGFESLCSLAIKRRTFGVQRCHPHEAAPNRRGACAGWCPLGDLRWRLGPDMISR